MNCDSFARQWVRAHLPRLVLILMILQPLLDVLSYWLEALGAANTLTLLLRFAMLAAILLAGFLVSERRLIYWISGGILLILTAGHIYACCQVGYDSPAEDLTNLLRIYHMPLITLCFISFLKAEPKVFVSFRKGMLWNLGIIALVVLLSVITGTNPYTYTNKSIGILGWFNNTSSQSAILSAAAPIAMAWAIERWKDKPVRLGFTFLICLGLLYLLSTRLAYLALFAAALGLAVTLLLVDRQRKGTIALLLACCVVFLALLPVSPMYRNQVAVAENAIKKQAKIDGLVAQDEAAAMAAGLTGKELKLKRLEGAYNTYLGGLVDRFGMERVATRYSYSDRASDLADVRRMRISYCAMMLEDSPVSAMLFGMELGDMTHNHFIYDAENDLHGIYYLCGAAGLVLTVLFLAFFLVEIIRALYQSWRQFFTIRTAGFGIAFLTCLTHVYATAGVLRRPNASIYLSVILACIFYLTKIEKEDSFLPEG